jgi:hypothetical protein
VLGVWSTGEDAYLRSKWYQLDAVIVIMAFIGIGVPGASVARALRALRPLRVIVRSQNIQVGACMGTIRSAFVPVARAVT